MYYVDIPTHPVCSSPYLLSIGWLFDCQDLCKSRLEKKENEQYVHSFFSSVSIEMDLSEYLFSRAVLDCLSIVHNSSIHVKGLKPILVHMNWG